MMNAILAIMCCALGVGAIFTQSPAQQPVRTKQNPGTLDDYRPGDWLKTPWTKRAPELESIKARAEALGRKGELAAKELVSLATSAKRTYKSAPTPENLFRWATYAYEAGRWSVDKRFGDNRENFPRDSDFNDHGPIYADVYIYARARYFRCSAIGPTGPIYRFGKRLLVKNPDDRDVKLALVRGAGAWTNELEAHGRKLAEELLAKYPNDPMTLLAAGRCHWSFWFTKRRKADWEKGIALCEKFISLAPPDLNSVAGAKRLVAQMKKEGYKVSGQAARR